MDYSKFPRLDEVEEIQTNILIDKVNRAERKLDENSQIKQLVSLGKLLREYVGDIQETEQWFQTYDILADLVEGIYENPIYKANPERFKKIHKDLLTLEGIAKKVNFEGIIFHNKQTSAKHNL